MKKFFKKAFKLLKETYKEFSEDDTWVLGASLSYYTIFSLAPIIIIVISVAGAIFGEEAVRGQIFGQLRDLLGDSAAQQVQEMIKNAYEPGKSKWATILAIGLLIFGATTVFYQLQSALNKIWEVKPVPKRGYIKYLKDRFLSFTLILGIGFLLLVSLVLNAALVAFSNYIAENIWEGSQILFQILDLIFSFGVITLLFAMIYRFLPDAKVRWSDVWIGAGVTATLFTLGRYLIALYLGTSDMGSTYGAAGSLVLILVWVNYSSQILFFGAEFTQVYARDFGRRIQPTQYAVRVKKVEVEQKDHESAKHFEEKLEEVEKMCETDKGEPMSDEDCEEQRREEEEEDNKA